ncbi:YhfG family protein [Shimwellia blattae]|uniref:DUF2559 family protein n=1 Tax=Shimwellia blattae (strain ATCC 29907 / DSM 4481 / JCM 1650 / NBRC 105725 / CDC 9005-74) TaxID=630626 RepID=I2B4D6_SHIBC|nr:YhfG family protein [Shimwellia blattae]AFJ45390.1 hypothetical protein EBL_c02550 [Shimwellia blattae DSM 4481 = NBRC 105725]GAB82875.1 hypothetical protein YhfG [Shimwellia blattae DSM 4481 = NBRC 105725]VDY62870.1 Protein of uncharacterised function (DUF2559) [Shimwellia blattae]VEC19794.1 Protein of uncharacterised function (DUF2559) [Shimwellia blattae]
MGRKLTDRQKTRLWERVRARNFQASQQLEGFTAPLVIPDPAHPLEEALKAARRRYG